MTATHTRIANESHLARVREFRRAAGYPPAPLVNPLAGNVLRFRKEGRS